MARLQRDMNRLFTQMPTGLAGDVAPTFPAMNVWTDEDGAVVADMPRVDENSVDITLEQNVLTINGYAALDEPEGYRLAYAEYRVGDCQRRFTISY
jgi:HSP20 family molecular chaperone IbpA